MFIKTTALFLAPFVLIIECLLPKWFSSQFRSKPSEQFSQVGDSQPSISSTSHTNSFSHIWCINDIERYTNEDQPISTKVNSVKFSPPSTLELELPTELHGTQFEICLRPRGSNRWLDYVCIFVYLTSNHEESVKVPLTIKFTILNAQGEKVNVRECTCMNLNDTVKSWGLFDWIKREDLVNPEKGYLVEGKLTICCEITFLLYETTKESDIIIPEKVLTRTGEKEILDHMKGLWDIHLDYSDVILEFEDGQKLGAIKALLIASSPVLGSIFENKSRENRIKIPAKNLKIGQQFLHYLYTGIVTESKFAEDLLPLAEKYQLHHLKQICEQKLCTQISVETVRNFVQFAELYKLAKLSERCHLFVQKKAQELIQNSNKALDLAEFLFK